MSRVPVFVDIETSGLDRDRHEILELAWAVDDGPVQVVRPRHTLRFADPVSLRVNRYTDRLAGLSASSADEVSRFLLDARGNTVVAANPAFDTGFLQAHFQWAPWHYRLRDIESFAEGVLGLPEVPSLRTLQRILAGFGYQIDEPDHSAGADVTTLRQCYLALRNEQLITQRARPELACLVPPGV